MGESSPSRAVLQRDILRSAGVKRTHQHAGTVLKKPAVNKLIQRVAGEYPVEPHSVHSRDAPTAAALRAELADLCGVEYTQEDYPRPFRVDELEQILETLREHTEG